MPTIIEGLRLYAEKELHNSSRLQLTGLSGPAFLRGTQVGVDVRFSCRRKPAQPRSEEP